MWNKFTISELLIITNEYILTINIITCKHFIITLGNICMIKLNLPVLFAQRGIRVADADRLSKLGRSTLYRMYNNEVTRIDFDSLNELCKLLDCTPGDIILYEEDKVCEEGASEES